MKKSKWAKNTEKMLSILVHKGIQLKTTLRFHLTSVIMAVIKNTTNNKCWQGHREKGTLIHCR
jgi:hypothetical protein